MFLAPAALAGCVHPSEPLSVKSHNPLVKIPAIKQAVREDDRAVLPQLVHDLDSDDAAVRFFAIAGLRHITGKDFGYRFYDDKIERRPAIEQWRQWLATQEKQPPMVEAHD
jgi:hypothetical protein